MEATPIYRWSGEFFGHIYLKQLIDSNGDYIGRLKGNDVWRADGTYLGEIVDQNYILRRINDVREPELPSVQSDAFLPPQPYADRPSRTELNGWVDALDEYK